MSTIRDNYYKIDSLFEKHKKNSDKGLIIEIFDEKEQQKFFLEQMSKITEKLYNIYNDNNFKEIKKIKMNKNKVVYVSVWENNPIVSASNITNLLKATDNYFGACDKYNNSSKRISWEESDQDDGSQLIGKIVYSEVVEDQGVEEQVVFVYFTDLYDYENIENLSMPEFDFEETGGNELNLRLGLCRNGAISNKKRIFWEIQLFAIVRSFKDGITFFNFDINWDRFVSEHTPSFKIEFTIFNIFNSIHIYKNNY